MLEVPVLRGGRDRTSLDARLLLSYRGDPVARVHLAPALLVGRTAAELRRAAPPPQEDPAPLWPMIARAGDLFASADLGGLTPGDHGRLVTLATGAPIAGVERSMAELAGGLQSIADAVLWQGDQMAVRHHRLDLGRGRLCAWVPVGRVLGFIAPSNHPAVHLTWVLALALGWTVLLRPGADDPLTPWRLALALQAAGFPMERLAMLSGGHDLVPAIIAACDRTIAYGGPALGSLIGQDSRVLFNGPGHSKVLVDGPVQVDPAADFLLECIAHDGGRKCTCASSAIIRGEAPGLADALAARLAALPLLDPLDPAAVVPAWKEPAGLAGTPARGAQQDGLTFARPELVRCPDPSQPPFGVELPTPWATLAELPAGADPMPILKNSLAVTLTTGDRSLIQQCLHEPSILKVFMGAVPPWHTEPGAPHHGRLGEFLFTSKACREVTPPWN